MQIQYITLIGISLAMDALGVTLSISLNKNLKSKNIFTHIISFSFFQFLFTFLGASFGFLFNKYITAIPSIIGGIVMICVGILMIGDGINNKDDTILLKPSTSLLLGISVSIDALVIGFTTFYNLGNIPVLIINSVYIGLITMFICTLGYFSCKIINKIQYIVKYSDFIGGTALIIFGLKMIFV